jgi:hypothetical protein
VIKYFIDKGPERGDFHDGAYAPDSCNALIKNIILQSPTLPHMNKNIFICLMLIFAGAVSVGCIQDLGPGATPAITPVQTSDVTQPPAIPIKKPSFTLGDHYLKNSYTFPSEKQMYTEIIRVDNSSWGIEFDVRPLQDDVIFSWFEMNVTNMDTGLSDTYGYGRTNGFELRHLIPMYNTGPYKIEMRGNLVKVDVTVAKRNP